MKDISSQRGFTLVELVTIMIVIGILGVVVMPRFFGRTGFDARGFSDQTRAMLGYAQKIAIAQRRPVFVVLDGNRVALCYTAACATPADLVPAPGGANSANARTRAGCQSGGAYVRAWFCEGVPDGVTVTRTHPYTVISFDRAGTPSHPGGVLTQAFGISYGADGQTHQVVVERETGYVHS